MPHRSPTYLRALAAGLFSAAALTGCTSIGEIHDARAASAVLVSAQGVPAGTAAIGAAGDRWTLTVAVAGLSQGVHGIHLHTTGRCDAPGFASAGGHLNPTGHQHGSLNPGGSHLGDLPNLAISSNGRGTVTAMLQGERGELERALFDTDGTALVIHAAADDYKTDPSGNSGARIACGVLTRN